MMKKFYVMMNNNGYIEVNAQDMPEAMAIFKIHYRHLEVFAILTERAFKKKYEDNSFRVATIRNSFNKVQAIKYMAEGYCVGIRDKDIYKMNNFGDIYNLCHKAIDYNALDFDADYYIPAEQ